MKTTRVAAVSMNGYLGETEKVLRAIDGWCKRAVGEKAEQRALANYTLRTRRPELFSELIREQVRC